MNHYTTEVLGRQRNDQYAQEADRDTLAALARSSRPSGPNAEPSAFARLLNLASRLMRRPARQSSLGPDVTDAQIA